MSLSTIPANDLLLANRHKSHGGVFLHDRPLHFPKQAPISPIELPLSNNIVQVSPYGQFVMGWNLCFKAGMQAEVKLY